MPTPIVYYEWYNKKAEKKEQLNHLISFLDRSGFSMTPEREGFRETFTRFEFVEVLRRVVAVDSRSLN